ncbi:hypothetical protein SAMN04487928_10745 [Butyrivibrio proteoclasticus]|uniref:Lipoprotein n=1 Tax=Butyrivibrio proteoclasticus TaxID=43305 RepID=A0A1I5SSV9_9FIRM|nr:hypothetical protein [Butyrivibrio proteoclasticus]SFP73825.1 hypothetical protein SAMN04487928_10745 [Butyrivibrio proteoclasticus]
MMKKQFFLLYFIFLLSLSGCSLEQIGEHEASAELSLEQIYSYFETEEEDTKEDSGQYSTLEESGNDMLSDSSDVAATETKSGILSDPSDINLRDTYGNGKNYVFTYGNEEFSAVYTTDNWRIYDSYKINNTEDITIICEALIRVHQIHGSDMESYRTAEDMAYEWLQHNIAYQILSDDSSWKVHAQNVDLDPKDQGKSISEIYEDRTGKEFNIKEFLQSP